MGPISIAFCIAAFGLGARFGSWIADREWRGKGEPDATRMSSGGHLYRVIRLTGLKENPHA